MPLATAKILVIVVLTNIVLALFNLVPVPPLDGSKILFAALPGKMAQLRDSLERYGFVLTIFFIFFLWQFFAPLIFILFTSLTGLSV